MIAWKDIVRPIEAVIYKSDCFQQAIRVMREHQTDLALVKDDDNYVGYCTLSLLLDHIGDGGQIDETVTYQTDMITVPETSEAEFPHNITLIVSENRKQEATGFVTLEDARNKMNAYRLKELNEMLHGSGIGIVKTNLHYEIEFMNEEAESIIGIPSDFLLLRNYKTLLTMDKDLDQFAQ